MAAEDPELFELACFFDQVFGSLKMPRHEQVISGPGGRRGLARFPALAVVAVLAACCLIGRAFCRMARAVAAAEAWYSSALVTGQAPILSDARAASGTDDGAADPDPG